MVFDESTSLQRHRGRVIPVYDDWPGLQRCLAALACQTYPRELLRLRVVNNGSSDWPADPAFPLPVDVLHHRRPGSYGARNRAALGWAVDVLAFTDADCEPTPHWIEQGVRSLVAADERVVLSAGRIVLTAMCAEAPTAAEQLDQILGFDQERTVRRAGFGVTANLFVPQAVFAELGGFHARARRRHTPHELTRKPLFIDFGGFGGLLGVLCVDQRAHRPRGHIRLGRHAPGECQHQKKKAA